VHFAALALVGKWTVGQDKWGGGRVCVEGGRHIGLAFVLLEPSDPSVWIVGKGFRNLLTPIDAAYAVLLFVWLLVSAQAPARTRCTLLQGKVRH
jgi:hypothetical protein